MMRVAVGFRAGNIVRAALFSGLALTTFEMLVALFAERDTFLSPLRMIGAIVLGPGALEPGYSLAGAATTGFLVHMLLALIFATIFAALVTRLTAVHTLTMCGMVFGAVLWLVNFHIVAPLAGWTWFPDRTDPAVQFIAHTFFYGCPLGWYLGMTPAGGVFE